MKRDTVKLTVYFEDPFWVGIVERIRGGRLEAGKVVFGSEPKDYEIQNLILEKWESLHFSPAVESDVKPAEKINPKRMQRAVNRQVHKKGIGTKAQQALKLQHEQAVKDRKAEAKIRREERKQKQFELRSKKRKEKHKGH